MKLRRAGLLAAVLSAQAFSRAAVAQIPFYSGSAGTYLGYCTAAGTGEVLTPNCADSYDQLVETVQLLIGNSADAYHFNETDLEVLSSLCVPGPAGEPSCVTQQQNLALGYLGGLPASSGAAAGACQTEFAPNAAVFFENTLPFFCLANSEGQSCMVQISQALAASGAPDAAPKPRMRPQPLAARTGRRGGVTPKQLYESPSGGRRRTFRASASAPPLPPRQAAPRTPAESLDVFKEVVSGRLTMAQAQTRVDSDKVCNSFAKVGCCAQTFVNIARVVRRPPASPAPLRHRAQARRSLRASPQRTPGPRACRLPLTHLFCACLPSDPGDDLQHRGRLFPGRLLHLLLRPAAGRVPRVQPESLPGPRLQRAHQPSRPLPRSLLHPRGGLPSGRLPVRMRRLD